LPTSLPDIASDGIPVISLSETDGVPSASLLESSVIAKSPLRSPSFLALWLGQLICFTGNNVYGLALMWEMKVLTGSTIMMSTVSIASLVPMIVLGPIAGTFVDRWSKRTAMILSDIVRAITISALTVLLATGSLAPWMLIAGAALNSVFGTVYTPANSAIMPLIVGRENLQKANSLSQGTMVMTGMIGPFLGGFLVAHVSMTSAFAVNAVAYLASVISLLFVRTLEPAKTNAKLSLRQLGVELKEGLDVIREIPLVRKMIPVSLIANFLFAPFDLILIQYCSVTLHGGAQLFGTLGSCFSAGMLLGAVFAGAAAKRIKKGHLITTSFVLCSLMMVFMGLTRTVWLALALAVLMGLFNMMLNILMMTIVQVQIPQEKMGRVFGTVGTLSQASQPFAQALAGFLLNAFRAPVLMCVLGTLATVNALWAATQRQIREVA